MADPDLTAALGSNRLTIIYGDGLGRYCKSNEFIAYMRLPGYTPHFAETLQLYTGVVVDPKHTTYFAYVCPAAAIRRDAQTDLPVPLR